MNAKYPESREEAVVFLKSFVRVPDTYSEFEMAIREYLKSPDGKYKQYLAKVIECAPEVKHRVGGFFGMGDLEIETLVDGTFPKVSRQEVA